MSATSNTNAVVNQPHDDQEQDVADVMQMLASSYDVSYTSFEGNLKSLLHRGVNDLFKPAPPRASSLSSSQASSSDAKPFWHLCVTKFHTAYLKASRQSSAFKKMFVNFFEANADELCRPLFSEDSESVADGFFKLTDKFPGPSSAAARAASAAATGTSPTLEGPVVYFDMTSSLLASVCIPIGEMYRAAIKQYLSAPPSNLKKKLLPTLTLLDFYASIYHSLPEDHSRRWEVERNLADLCEAAEAVAPGSGPGNSSLVTSDSSQQAASSPFEMLAKAFSGAGADANGGLEGAFGSIAGIVTSLASVGGVNPAVAGDMTNAIKSVGSSVKTLVDKLSEIKKEDGGEGGNPIDNEQFVEALGTIFQSGEVKQQLSQTLKTASAVFGALSGNGASSSATSQDDTTTVDPKVVEL